MCCYTVTTSRSWSWSNVARFGDKPEEASISIEGSRAALLDSPISSIRARPCTSRSRSRCCTRSSQSMTPWCHVSRCASCRPMTGGR